MMAVRDLLPHHHAAYLQIGRLLARQRKYDEAQQALGEAARLRPDVAEVRIELGQVAAARGQLDDALQHFAAAQANHEDDARVCLLRAAVLDKQNKRAEAVQSLREAIRLRPTLAEAYDQLGIRLAIDGNFAEAQAVFEEFVRLKPEDAEGYLNLGIALARQHKLEEARKRFQKTLELDPGNQRARDFLKAMDDAGR
jgi:Flp pilus assembly protein TadD